MPTMDKLHVVTWSCSLTWWDGEREASETMFGPASLGVSWSAVNGAETREVPGDPHGMVAGLSVGSRRAEGSCLVVAASRLVGTTVVPEARVDSPGSGLVALGGCRLVMAGAGRTLKAVCGTAGDGVVMEASGSVVDDGVATEACGSTVDEGMLMEVPGSITGDGVVMNALGSTADDGVVMKAFVGMIDGAVVTKALDVTVGDGAMKKAFVGMVGNIAEVATGNSMVDSVLMGKAANDSTSGAAVGKAPRDSKVDIPCDDVEVNGRDGLKGAERGRVAGQIK